MAFVNSYFFRHCVRIIIKKIIFIRLELQYLAGYHYKCSGLARYAIMFVPISTLYSLEIHRLSYARLEPVGEVKIEQDNFIKLVLFGCQQTFELYSNSVYKRNK